MQVNRYYYGYSNKKKHVTGKGFVDSLSSIFQYHKNQRQHRCSKQ